MPPEDSQSGLFHVRVTEFCPIKRFDSALMSMEFKYGIEEKEPVELRTRFDLLKDDSI